MKVREEEKKKKEGILGVVAEKKKTDLEMNEWMSV
jgi:hypothetical protein